ncbi:MAG: hypothetical protein OH338_00345 [Candidatus Parvarchaeota archaeon]|jgi:hypothetical protein|nr:hypothetical protein [Candidatus Parvarchaeota archaeon]MCW1295682.1 hypothetical protein [Candidatus Parvarchaeum tengchongense]MCW1299050.1 hypothetical protein [Candidatus Parvarchaeum tengchongense]MCW1311866.1 hypothetical protein [Candidatus Parvarchaeum tengchongense]
MEAEVLTRQAGFFLSSLTTISLAVLSIEFILDYKLSFFPFSFIIVLYLAGLYLRNRFWRKAWKKDRKTLFRYSYVIIWIIGIALLLIFLYFGNSQITVFPLGHYALNPYLLLIALLWTVYSVFEIYMVNSISSLAKYKNANYLAIAAIVLVDLSFLLMNHFVYILPISLFLLSLSTFVSSIRVAKIY